MTIRGLILLLRKCRSAFGIPFARSVSMSAASDALKARTENFAVGVVTFCETLPNSIAALEQSYMEDWKMEDRRIVGRFLNDDSWINSFVKEMTSCLWHPCRSFVSMSAASDALKARTENFAVGVVTFCETLPNSIAALEQSCMEDWEIEDWRIVGRF